MATAIRRCLGSKSASKITMIEVSGNAVMADGNGSSDSASAVLPNLQYADVSNFNGGLKEYAFEECRNLTTVVLPEKNVKLPAYCFMNCTKLSTIYRANSNSKIINEADLTGLISGSTGQFAAQTQCFQGCTSLRTIKLPNTSKVRFSQYVFNGCSNLSTIYIDTQTPVVGEGDLTGFTELLAGVLKNTAITTVKLPKDVNILKEAFQNCTKLKMIQVHPAQTSNITVDSTAFYNVNASCKVYMNQDLYKTSIVFRKSSTELIPKEINALYTEPLDDEIMSDMLEWYLSYYSINATSVKHLVIANDGVMGDSNSSESASVLPNLETVDMSTFTGEIGSHAFYNCAKLKSVIRNSDFSYVPAQCFMNCRKLTSIIEYGKYPQIWNEADLTDLSGELAIDTQGIEECTSLETVKLPSTKIGLSGAFAYCSELSTIYKDGNEKQERLFDLTDISNFWVGWGHNFKNTDVSIVKLPYNKDISEYCFYNCLRLEKIEFDSAQTSPVTIGSCAFYGVSPNCEAFMHSILANNSSFQLKRNATTNITKKSY